MARKPSAAAKPAHPAAPDIVLPAVYANHAHISWAGGVIRLTMSEALGDQTIQRAALLITTDQARELQGLLAHAVAALMPEAATEEITAA